MAALLTATLGAKALILATLAAGGGLESRVEAQPPATFERPPAEEREDSTAPAASVIADEPETARDASEPESPFWKEVVQSRLHAERSALSRVARNAMPAVVSISTQQEPSLQAALSGIADDSQQGIGSGFIIHPDGLILTSAHVIEGASEIYVTTVTREGASMEHLAVVVGMDSETDCALLKIDAGRQLPVLPLSSSAAVDVADWVVVIGSPFGLAHSVTVGVVSYKGRTDVVPSGRSGYFDYLQTDASINPGNSGGPMLDVRGHVVGIANAVNVAGQGIGFGIPIEMAKEILPQLKEHGRVRRGWMGIAVQDLTPNVAMEIGYPSYSGVIVSEVVEGSPAHESGIRVGDIILDLEGEPMPRSHSLRWEVATRTVGEPIRLGIERNGEPLDVSVMLTDKPGARYASPHDASPALLDMGVAVTDVDEASSQEAGLAHPFGALVREVLEGSIPERAGLSRGDVVLKVNEREVDSGEDFQRTLQSLPPGSVVRLFLRRNASTLTLSFEKP